ncbi:MAG TPA: TonB-dependent receptor, partial [Gemmatimonadaceae bacterium]
VYSALDVSDTRSPAATLSLRNPAELQRLQLSADSAMRFLDIANGLGIPSSSATVIEPQNKSASFFTRIDYALSEHNSLAARVDWRGFELSGLGASPLTLPIRGSGLRSRDGGVLAELTSTWAGWTNELRAYNSAGSSGTDAGIALPSGQVRVISSLDNGTLAPSLLSFGGQPGAPEQQHSLLETSDDLVHETATGAHRLEAGFLLQEQRASPLGAFNNRSGSFTFNGLDDLQNGRPASFTRDLSFPAQIATRQYAGAYVGDMWKNSDDALSLTYGLRMDASRYDERPAPTPTVEALANGGSAQIPSELIVTPRFGVAYKARHWSVNGGIGGFTGAANLQSLASPWSETGEAGVSLTCIGPSAPTPDWARFANDPAAVPSMCADGTSIFSSSVAPATLFDRGFGSPRTWRASLGGSRDITGSFSVTLDGSVIHGTHLPTARDLNLVPSGSFALAGEGGRLVYVPATAIDVVTGGIAPGASRTDPSLGTVREIASRGESWTEQLSAEANSSIRGGTVSLDYTFTRSRMLQNGVPAPGAFPGTTAGDPAQLEWTNNPFTPEHVFQLVAGRRFAHGLHLTAIGRLSSGLPFTPQVSGDINGDGFLNDRAFVFDPATTADAALGREMTQLENTATGPTRDCLRRQTGRIAAAGSCETDWSPSLDLRAQIYAIGDITSRRLLLTFTASNVTAGLDYLLHGPDKLHGWGQFANPDPTPLEIRG